MDVHEWQAKEILRSYKVPVPEGGVSSTADGAVDVARKIGGSSWAVKAQIHAGGRGKGSFLNSSENFGGVRIASTLDDVSKFSGSMLGKYLVTKQTESCGKKVNKVYVEKCCPSIEKEFYVSFLVDRKTACIGLVVSASGGMNIEDVALKEPDKVLNFSIYPETGILGFHGRAVAHAFGLDLKQYSRVFQNILTNLYSLFVDKDCQLLEINPLVLTKDGDVFCLDCKMSFDDNALYRREDIASLRDESEENPLDVLASKHGLSYIAMDGSIGCMVNGAGLAMTTMDLINLYGAKPANFLDVGGSAAKEKISEALNIIASDEKVRGILINIFGGIMKCDVIAEGVVSAKLNVPVVMRLVGTNADLGKEIIKNSSLNVEMAESLAEASKKIVDIVNSSSG